MSEIFLVGAEPICGLFPYEIHLAALVHSLPSNGKVTRFEALMALGIYIVVF
jgi:hypothetical protein